MATGIGNLPNPSMSFTPFDILTAEEMNNLVENIESLADGTGVGDKAVALAKINGGSAAGTFVTDASGVVTISPIGLKTIDTSAATALSSAGTYKTFVLTGLTIGNSYELTHMSPGLGASVSAPGGTIRVSMVLDGTTLLAEGASIMTSGSYQNPRFTLTGDFIATATSHTITFTITGNNVTPTTDKSQRTVIKWSGKQLP